MPEDELVEDVNAEGRIGNMSMRKDEYTLVFKAQMDMLKELEDAICPADLTSPESDENIRVEKERIEAQRVAIRKQHVSLMLKCAAEASNYGASSPAPVPAVPKNRPSSTTSSASQRAVQSYSYQPSTPLLKHAAAPAPSMPVYAQPPAPAYTPTPASPPDMTAFEGAVPQSVVYAPQSPITSGIRAMSLN